MRGPELVVDGLAFPEGLAWSAETGTLLCCSVQTATVHRIWPEQSRRETVAGLGAGGANNLVLAADGGVIVCQNGGVDAGPPIAARYPEMEPLPAALPTTVPGLIHVSSEGELRDVLRSGVNAPNDIIVDPAGDLVFTDPGNPFLSPRATPRLMRYSPEGGLSVVADGFAYCNGVFADGDSLLVTDHGGVLRFAPDGSREWVIRYDDGNVDGLTVDADGRIYVARQANGGVDVIQDGVVVEFLALPAPAMTTNVCFGGPDGTSLFVTDARQGAVWLFTSLPAAGAPVMSWAPPRSPAVHEIN